MSYARFMARLKRSFAPVDKSKNSLTEIQLHEELLTTCLLYKTLWDKQNQKPDALFSKATSSTTLHPETKGDNLTIKEETSALSAARKNIIG